jgi:hypothetical protein
MPISIEKLKALTPVMAMNEISGNISVSPNANKTILYSTKIANSFEEFQATRLVVSLDRFDQVGGYSTDALECIESFYLYGAYILANGKADGCLIEKHKDGELVCVVTNDSICTMSLIEAEKYLYENWYVSEYTSE